MKSVSKGILSLIGFFMSVHVWAQTESYYLIHSSGNVLGCGTDSRAVLKAPNDKSLQPLSFERQSDGSYLISIEDDYSGRLYLSLGTSNAWSTFFLKDASTNRARYTLEKNGQYTKLKNANTGKYLGTDDNNAGSSTFSDKSGSDTKHLWVMADDPNYKIPVDTISYPIVIDAKRQQNEGWGVSLCWWAGQCGKWSDKKIDQLVDWMVSPTGLNWNLFRYNIGGGDDPNWKNCTQHHMDAGKGRRAEMEGFQDERGGEYHWERDAAQRKIMLKIKEKRPDAVFEAFSNSAPWWMTVSGCVAGNAEGGKDNLKKEYYEDFADYLVEVCKHYKEQYGIEFKTLEPFNEAMTSYWHKSGVQEGCHFNVASEIAFLKVLAPKLKASGLNTKISASDETSVMDALGSMREMMKDGIANEVAQFNTHTYGASHAARSQFGSLSRAAGKACWMSETGAGGTGIGGNLNMTQRLFDDVRYICPDAWIDWQYMEEANDQWCFVKGSFANATVSKVKNYYVRQQVTRFIPSGYTFVTSLNEQSLSAINPSGDTLVVALLNTGTETYHRISLPMAKVDGEVKAWRTSNAESLKSLSASTIIKEESDSVLIVKLPEASLTTLIIPIYTNMAESEELVAGDTYLIIPQSNATQAVGVVGTGVKLVTIDASDPSQQWIPEEDASGSLRLKNGKGQYVTTSSSYALSLSNTNKSKTQLFDIDKVDGIFSRIIQHGDANHRGWDLQGATSVSGTPLGLWAYGTSADADTRQFQFVRIKSAEEMTDGISDIIDAENVTINPQTEELQERCAIYDLSGRKVTSSTLKKGIYIKGGKKVTY